MASGRASSPKRDCVRSLREAIESTACPLRGTLIVTQTVCIRHRYFYQFCERFVKNTLTLRGLAGTQLAIVLIQCELSAQVSQLPQRAVGRLVRPRDNRAQ